MHCMGMLVRSPHSDTKHYEYPYEDMNIFMKSQWISLYYFLWVQDIVWHQILPWSSAAAAETTCKVYPMVIAIWPISYEVTSSTTKLIGQNNFPSGSTEGKCINLWLWPPRHLVPNSNYGFSGAWWHPVKALKLASAVRALVNSLDQLPKMQSASFAMASTSWVTIIVTLMLGNLPLYNAQGELRARCRYFVS